MVAEDRSVMRILHEMLSKEGVSLNVRDISFYARKEEICSYFALALRAQRFDEVLVGYLQRGSAAEEAQVNPKNKQEERCWVGFDLIVLSGVSSSVAAGVEEEDVAEKTIKAFETHHHKSIATEMIKGDSNPNAQKKKNAGEEFSERVSTMGTDEREIFLRLMESMVDMARNA